MMVDGIPAKHKLDGRMNPEQLESRTAGEAHTPGERDGYFQCGFCKKHYNRADHLIRHVRSHTREKPYVCHICNKGFARSDLVKRHTAGHNHDRVQKRKSASKNSRVSQACKSCAASKLKCDDTKPCQQCRQKSLTCDWVQDDNMIDASPKQSQEQVFESRDQAVDYVPLEALHAPATPTPGTMDEYSASLHAQSYLTSRDVEVDDNLPAQQLSQANSDMMPFTNDGQAVSPTTDRESGVFSIDGTFFPDFIPGSLIPSLSRFSEADLFLSHPQEYAHYGAFDHNLQLDFDLTDVDFGLIDIFNARGVAENVRSNAEPSDQSNDLFETDSGIAIGEEAYHRSSLSAWKPAHEDHAFVDQEHLSVPKTVDSPDSAVIENAKILSERLSTSSRDLIFGMVLNTTRRSNITRIMKSFPSTELLDSLIQQFFKWQQDQVDSWIHGPTFHPNNEEPEILVALAAAGATQSAIPTIRKLGYALMEVIRLRLPGKYEADNSLTRDLRNSQAYSLTIDVGIWSGNGRKKEIAESSEQPLVTMLRRALRFRRSMYSTIIPNADDSGQELEKKWHDWVEQESFKRLVYRLFLHDAQVAISLNINPLISYAELELPLPIVRQLWEAKTAIEWKEAHLSLGLMSLGRLPSLADALHDMSQLTSFQWQIDVQFAAFVVLHGIMALINEHHRLKFISKGHSKHWHALVTNSRHQEVYQALQYFRLICYEWHSPPEPQILLVCEVASMFLHMSLEELQLFAGKEDKKEARRVYHSALEWINSADSRRAVWHAGQVIRAAKAMSPISLTRFFAISVYYAGLAFWSYSVVSKAKHSKVAIFSPSSAVQLHDSHPTIFLDAEETKDVQKFICLGRGHPALQGADGPAFLSEPGLAMQVAQAVLHADIPYDALSPLVQSLCQLMHDLGSAATSSAPSSPVRPEGIGR